jgi:hypothetical protein
VSERSVVPAPLSTRLKPFVPVNDYRTGLVDGSQRPCRRIVEGLTSREGLDIVRALITQRSKDDSIDT